MTSIIKHQETTSFAMGTLSSSMAHLSVVHKRLDDSAARVVSFLDDNAIDRSFSLDVAEQYGRHPPGKIFRMVARQEFVLPWNDVQYLQVGVDQKPLDLARLQDMFADVITDAFTDLRERLHDMEPENEDIDTSDLDRIVEYLQSGLDTLTERKNLCI